MRRCFAARHIRFLASLALAGVALAMPDASRAQSLVPVGPELLIDATGRHPAVAVADDGSFAAVWSESPEWLGQRFDSGGVPSGSVFTVGFHSNFSRSSSIAFNGSSDFVVAWNKDGTFLPPPISLTETDIYARRYGAAGPLAAEFPVHLSFCFDRVTPQSVAARSNGDFVVTWASVCALVALPSGIFGNRYDSAGQFQGFFQATGTTTNSDNPSVAMDGSGAYVVVWTGNGPGDSSGVFGQRFDSSDVPQGGVFLVNTYTTGSQSKPRVAKAANGAFVVVWSGEGAGDDSGVFGQRYDGSGVAQGGEFQLNTHTAGFQGTPAVAADGTGNFVAVWRSGSQFGPAPGDQDGDAGGIFGQAYDAAGATLGGEFQVNTTTTDSQKEPSIAAGPNGSFVVIWRSDGQGVAGQRLSLCGDGILSAAESCDDGNTAGGDCCSAACQFEAGQGMPDCCVAGVCNLSTGCGASCLGSGTCQLGGVTGDKCLCLP